MSNIAPDDFDDLEDVTGSSTEDFEPTHYVRWREFGVKLWGEYLGRFKFEHEKYGEGWKHKIRGGKGLTELATNSEEDGKVEKERDLEDKVVTFVETGQLKRILTKEQKADIGDPIYIEYTGKEGDTKIYDIRVPDKEKGKNAQDVENPVEEAATADNESADTMSKEEVEEKIKELAIDSAPFIDENNWRDCIKEETGLELEPENYKDIVQKLK